MRRPNLPSCFFYAAFISVSAFGCGRSGDGGAASGGSTGSHTGSGGTSPLGMDGATSGTGGLGTGGAIGSGGTQGNGGDAATSGTGGLTSGRGGITSGSGGASSGAGGSGRGDASVGIDGATTSSGGTAAGSGGITTGVGGTSGIGGITTGVGGSTTSTGGAITGAGGSEKRDANLGTGGTTTGAGGSERRDANPGVGGTGAGGKGSGGSTADGGGAAPGGDCVVGTWPAADPSAAGPFATVTENDIGPQAGAIPDGGTQPRFTMFRPRDMAQGGLCHPVVTWGNGTNATPTMYKSLLGNLASHGFVVIASNSANVLQGNPAPMLAGVTWVLEQNADPTSVLYHRIDTSHVGATGHSQGAMATSQASGDSHITTSVPIEGAFAQSNLHGPAMFFCGGDDSIVGCDGARSALAAVTTLPAMYAEYLSVDHGSWMGRSTPSVVEATVTAWMRVHLMGDPDLRSWFYGPSCKLCTDSGWSIDRKNMDQ
jgi:hypothetical protein